MDDEPLMEIRNGGRVVGYVGSIEAWVAASRQLLTGDEDRACGYRKLTLHDGGPWPLSTATLTKRGTVNLQHVNHLTKGHRA